VAVVSAAAVGLLIRVASAPSLKADLRRQQAEKERADLFSMNPSPTLLIRVSDRCFADVNDAFARTFGYTRDEVIGRTALDLNLWQDPKQRDALMGLLRERGTVDGYMGDLLDREGRPISMLATLRLVEIDGEPHVLGTFQDISALRRAEEEVRRSARRLETLNAIGRAILAAQSTDGIGRVGLSLLRGRVACTRATLARFEPASQDLEVVALVTDDETEVRLGARFPLSAVGQMDALLRGETHRIPDTLEIEDPSLPVQRLIEEGVRAYVNFPLVTAGELIGTMNLTRATPGDFGEEDLQTAREVADLLAVAVVQSDLRDELQRRAGELEHRVAERTAALAESETRFRSVLANSPDATLLVDPAGAIELANDAAATLFGYETIELLGMSVEALVPESSRANHRAHQERYLTEPATRPMGTGLPLRARRRDGSEFAADISLSPIRIEAQGKPSVIAIVRDISERDRAEEEILAAKEEAERANRAKDDFLSRMSHELRTPMNSVLGFAQLMEMEIDDGPHAESVRQILRAGRHLLGLIDEALDISRVDAGTIAVSLEPVGIRAVVVEAVDLVRPMANERGVSIHVEDANGLHVLADHQRLKQVVLNMLSNAVKYNRQGGTITIDCVEHEGGSIRIGVADTGPGVAPEHMERLFAPFDRLDVEQRSTAEGTGLGLALSKRLVEAMGGTMGVESEVGAGSTFWVELPSAADAPVEVAAASPVPSERSSDPSRGSGRPATVLYVEDNPANLALVQRILARRPEITLTTAMQGQMGLDLVRLNAPDLILLDLHLPDLSGDEVLKRLQADPETRGIPVVMVTADAWAGRAQKLLAAGARDCITKPFDVPRFLQLVDDILAEV
jgi:PAS domain S-box-containing protein